MGSKAITDLDDAGALSGAELLELSRLSATIKITATTISAANADQSYNDSANGFVAANFTVGMRVNVIGFTGDVANNIFVAVITALTTGKMTIGGPDGEPIVDDAAGESVTITKWESRRSGMTALATIIATMVPSKWKTSVRAATVAAVTLATGFENGDTIDGVVLATGDRVLNKDAAAPAENGIWVVAASGAPTRATDADSSSELVNATVSVEEGTANKDTAWICTTNSPIVVGTTALTWAAFGGGMNPASTTDILTGTDASKGATADAIAALWEQGANVASAGTVSLGEGGYFHITGTTGITDIDFATDKAGRKAWVIFDGALTITHNGATLILPGAANIVTAAGDAACFVSEGSDVVRCVSYRRATGEALLAPIQSITIACSDETTLLTTGTAKVTFRMPFAFKLTDIRASVTAAPTGSTIVVDVNEAGVTIMAVTKLSIDATELTSTTAATPPVISDPDLADDAEITIDIDQIGSTLAGKGLKVTLIGRRVG